jgi:integrase
MGLGGVEMSQTSRSGYRRALYRDLSFRCSSHPGSLRHTAATTMIRAGIPLPEIQVVLGHSSLQMLERYYSGVTARTATADSVSAFVDAERRERRA